MIASRDNCAATPAHQVSARLAVRKAHTSMVPAGRSIPHISIGSTTVRGAAVMLGSKRIVFGGIVALVSFAIFESTGAVYYLLAGVLVANVWEARRRLAWRARRLSPRADTVEDPGPKRPRDIMSDARRHRETD